MELLKFEPISTTLFSEISNEWNVAGTKLQIKKFLKCHDIDCSLNT